MLVGSPREPLAVCASAGWGRACGTLPGALRQAQGERGKGSGRPFDSLRANGGRVQGGPSTGSGRTGEGFRAALRQAQGERGKGSGRPFDRLRANGGKGSGRPFDRLRANGEGALTEKSKAPDFPEGRLPQPPGNVLNSTQTSFNGEHKWRKLCQRLMLKRT